MGEKRRRSRLRAVLWGAAVLLASVACGAGGASSGAADTAFLSQVHNADPSVNSLRSDTQLVRLGHAVCDDFSAGASYQEVADRLSVAQGAHALPPADLGAVISAAADDYCPRYHSAG